jgi:hypothetical protein
LQASKAARSNASPPAWKLRSGPTRFARTAQTIAGRLLLWEPAQAVSLQFHIVSRTTMRFSEGFETGSAL